MTLTDLRAPTCWTHKTFARSDNKRVTFVGVVAEAVDTGNSMKVVVCIVCHSKVNCLASLRIERRDIRNTETTLIKRIFSRRSNAHARTHNVDQNRMQPNQQMRTITLCPVERFRCKFCWLCQKVCKYFAHMCVTHSFTSAALALSKCAKRAHLLSAHSCAAHARKSSLPVRAGKSVRCNRSNVLQSLGESICTSERAILVVAFFMNYRQQC